MSDIRRTLSAEPVHERERTRRPYRVPPAGQQARPARFLASGDRSIGGHVCLSAGSHAGQCLEADRGPLHRADEVAIAPAEPHPCFPTVSDASPIACWYFCPPSA